MFVMEVEGRARGAGTPWLTSLKHFSGKSTRYRHLRENRQTGLTAMTFDEN